MGCKHCGRTPVTRPKGLCWTCYNVPGVKEQYPAAGIHGVRGVATEDRAACFSCNRPCPCSSRSLARHGWVVRHIELNGKYDQDLYCPDCLEKWGMYAYVPSMAGLNDIHLNDRRIEGTKDNTLERACRVEAMAQLARRRQPLFAANAREDEAA
jgi:hypothetical protein